MVIDLTYGGIIGIIIFLALMGLFAVIFSKKFPRLTKSPAGGAFFSAAPAAIICLPIFLMYLHPLHVIDKYYGGQTFMQIGSVEYDLGNGKKEKVPFEMTQSHVVNQSDQPLIVEVVYYGYAIERKDDRTEILPHSISKVLKIDYYPEQIPPQAMELKSSDEHHFYWLRIKKEGE